MRSKRAGRERGENGPWVDAAGALANADGGIRARLLAGETANFSDRELLEALLAFGSGQKANARRQAKTLIERFGTLGDVIAEDTELLLETRNVDEEMVLLFRLVQSIAVQLTRNRVRQRHAISSTDALIDYCRVALSRLRVERFLVLFLNSKNMLIGETRIEGTVDHAPVYPREIVKRALALNASSVILVHNHPSGDPTPSLADIHMTEKISSIGALLGVRVLDHLVMGRSGHVSFREQGLLGRQAAE